MTMDEYRFGADEDKLLCAGALPGALLSVCVRERACVSVRVRKIH